MFKKGKDWLVASATLLAFAGATAVAQGSASADLLDKAGQYGTENTAQSSQTSAASGAVLETKTSSTTTTNTNGSVASNGSVAADGTLTNSNGAITANASASSSFAFDIVTRAEVGATASDAGLNFTITAPGDLTNAGLTVASTTVGVPATVNANGQVVASTVSADATLAGEDQYKLTDSISKTLSGSSLAFEESSESAEITAREASLTSSSAVVISEASTAASSYAAVAKDANSQAVSDYNVWVATSTASLLAGSNAFSETIDSGITQFAGIKDIPLVGQTVYKSLRSVVAGGATQLSNYKSESSAAESLATAGRAANSAALTLRSGIAATTVSSAAVVSANFVGDSGAAKAAADAFGVVWGSIVGGPLPAVAQGISDTISGLTTNLSNLLDGSIVTSLGDTIGDAAEDILGFSDGAATAVTAVAAAINNTIASLGLDPNKLSLNGLLSGG
jgi:hypothetical protein